MCIQCGSPFSCRFNQQAQGQLGGLGGVNQLQDYALRLQNYYRPSMPTQALDNLYIAFDTSCFNILGHGDDLQDLVNKVEKIAKKKVGEYVIVKRIMKIESSYKVEIVETP